ncbi:hypothetical protein ACYPKM_04060 [Pseudomonas aeruginosa]
MRVTTKLELAEALNKALSGVSTCNPFYELIFEGVYNLYHRAKRGLVEQQSDEASRVMLQIAETYEMSSKPAKASLSVASIRAALAEYAGKDDPVSRIGYKAAYTKLLEHAFKDGAEESEDASLIHNTVREFPALVSASSADFYRTFLPDASVVIDEDFDFEAIIRAAEESLRPASRHAESSSPSLG